VASRHCCIFKYECDAYYVYSCGETWWRACVVTRPYRQPSTVTRTNDQNTNHFVRRGLRRSWKNSRRLSRSARNVRNIRFTTVVCLSLAALMLFALVNLSAMNSCYFCVIKKVWTLVIVPLSRKPTSESLRYDTRCKGFHSFTCTRMQLSANCTKLVLILPTPEGWKAELT